MLFSNEKRHFLCFDDDEILHEARESRGEMDNPEYKWIV